MATKPKLGSGARFQKLKNQLSGKKSVKNPGALAAFIGRKKFGDKKMGQLSQAGKKRSTKKRAPVGNIKQANDSTEVMKNRKAKKSAVMCRTCGRSVSEGNHEKHAGRKGGMSMPQRKTNRAMSGKELLTKALGHGK